MNREDRVFLIISIVVIILLLFATGLIYMMKESEKDKRINLQKQLDGLTIEKQNLEIKLKETETINAQASANIKFQEDKISMLSKEIEDEKAVNTKNIAKIQEKEFEIQNLKIKIEELKVEKEEVFKDLERLKEDYLNMKFQLENLIKTKEELEKKAKELVEREGVSLGTVVIKQSRN